MKKYLPLLFLLFVFSMIALFSWLDKRAAARIESSVTAFPTMSTIATCRFYGPPAETEKAVRCVRREMEKVVRICNIFDSQSELSRLNASAASKPFKCSGDLWSLLLKVREIHRFSNGAFDPTIRPLMHVWGFSRKRSKLPSVSELEEAGKLCGFRKIVFDDRKHTVFFPVKGMSLDLGGIAKGWAVDLAVEAVLEKTSIRSGIVDLGGNMRCLPNPPDRQHFYRIGVRDPLDPEKICGTFPLLNESISTSGGYERFSVIDGQRFAHIIDPRTLKPVSGTVLSASIIASSAAEADALSTSLFVEGISFLERLEKEKPSVRAVLVLRKTDGSSEFRTVGAGWMPVKL